MQEPIPRAVRRQLHVETVVFTRTLDVQLSSQRKREGGQDEDEGDGVGDGAGANTSGQRPAASG
ncbi:hypothetical protein GCM10009807_21450 [Microbacterium lacus]|uniref:Uncharacterized protein n=1 Tax=Microbacterium lacus TaxID=415217 RepID=A0ABN2GVB5_9MICO